LREFRNAVLAGSVLVPGPGELGEGGGARPHFRGDRRVVALLGPEGGFDAQDKRGFFLGEVRGEVVVVDSLPGFVGRAPVD
jgi:hypothetical protein